MGPYFREISASPLSLKIASLLQSKHPCVVARSADFSVTRDPIYYPHRFHNNTQIVHRKKPFNLNLLIINNICTFWSKKPCKYRCLIELLSEGFCSDDRLANEHAGQRQLWRHDGYLLYFDDRLANEHDGHNDYDAVLYYLFYFVRKLWLDLVWLIPILQPIRMIDIWNYVIVFKLGNSRVINDDL